MARWVYGTTNTSTSATAVQLFNTDTNARMFAIHVKSRKTNAVTNMYFGSDSNVSSASGWELCPGDSEPITFSDVQSSHPNTVATTKATSAWVNATSTADKLDFQILLEN